MDIFEFYCIKDKVGSITFDDASSNTATILMFMQRINPPNDFLLFHHRCVCHIINFIVRDGVMHEINIILKK